MNTEKIMEIFAETAYPRVGGSPEEEKAAHYLLKQLEDMGLEGKLLPFEVPVSQIQEATLTVDGEEIPCKGLLCAGSGEVEAPFYYLRNRDPWSMSQCRGKIVLIDVFLGYWIFQDLWEHGAVGVISFDGNANFADRDIDQRELRGYIHQGRRIPCVNINAKDAIAIVNRDAQRAKITLKQEETVGTSHNVLLDMPGKTEEHILFTAHYDSTSLSQGAWDNMSGCVGLLAMAEHFARQGHNYGLKFLWCGSEERGLLGSKAYSAEEENLKNCVLCINLDMIGSIMGKFISCVTAEEKLCHYISYLASELGFGIEVEQGVYSSDSTPIADKGVPAVSFARIAPPHTASYHNSYDTVAVLNAKQMVGDIAFITAFAGRMANAARCPVNREIPANVKEKLDNYLGRKRERK